MRKTIYTIFTKADQQIPAVQRKDVEVDAISATEFKAIVPGSGPAGFELDLINDDNVINFEQERVIFDYEAIETRLKKIGASEPEASALTDILHKAGWGGREFEGHYSRDIGDDTLFAVLQWLRSERGLGENALPAL